MNRNTPRRFKYNEEPDLQQWLDLNRMSQHELAERMGYSVTPVNLVATGTRSAADSFRLRLAKVVGSLRNMERVLGPTDMSMSLRLRTSVLNSARKVAVSA